MSPPAALDHYIALQPIFDRERQVYGYELLFRSGTENYFSALDSDRASSSVVHSSMSVFGLDSLVAGHRAFFNITRKLLVDGVVGILPKDRVIIELLENIGPDAEVMIACRALLASGYTLALDDFELTPESRPLLEVAEIVKVDFRAIPRERRAELTRELRRRPLRLLAEKVETPDEHAEAMELGYDYFQGYFYCRPAMRSVKEVPPLKLSCLALLREVSRPELDFDRVQSAIHADPTLAVRLLRFLNSAAFAGRRPISSLRQALYLLGEESLRRWAQIVALAAVGDEQPHELIVTCLQRARLCELLGPSAGLRGRESELFLMGLLSAVDVLIGRPMAEVLDQVGCSAEIGDALLGRSSALGGVIQLVLAYEQGRWDDVALHEHDVLPVVDSLPRFYQESVLWARATAHV